MDKNEIRGHLQRCKENLAKEVDHLKEFLADKDESYIFSNPEEIASEIILAAMSCAHIIGGHNTLEGIRKHGIVPQITFTQENNG